MTFLHVLYFYTRPNFFLMTVFIYNSLVYFHHIWSLKTLHFLRVECANETQWYIFGPMESQCLK